MAEKINVDERMKIFEGLTSMSDASIENILSLFQIAREARKKSRIEEEIRKLEEYLEGYERKSAIFDADRAEHAEKEARYKELESMLKNESDIKVDNSILDKVNKLKGLSDEEFEEKELQIRVYCKVKPYLASAMQTIKDLEQQYATQMDFLTISKRRAEETNNYLKELDTQISAKIAELNAAKDDEEEERIAAEYESLLEKRHEYRFKNIKSVERDLARIKEEHENSPELLKAYRTVEILTDRDNFPAIDKMTEEQIDGEIENVFNDRGKKIKLPEEKKGQGQEQGQGQGQGQEQKKGQGQKDNLGNRSKPNARNKTYGAGQNSAGQNSAGQNSAGQNSAGQDSNEEDRGSENESNEDPNDTAAKDDTNLPKHISIFDRIRNSIVKRKENRQAREDNFVKEFKGTYGNEPSKFKRFIARHPRIGKIAKSFSRYKAAYEEIEKFSTIDYNKTENPDGSKPADETTGQDNNETAYQSKHKDFMDEIHVDTAELHEVDPEANEPSEQDPNRSADDEGRE